MDLRATRAEISIENFKNNLKHFKNKIAGGSLCLSVKANAYGHGLIQMSKYAEGIVDFFAVATVNEGVRLREAGITLPILVMSTHIASEVPIICEKNLTPFVSHLKHLDLYQQHAKINDVQLPLHIKVDTGMGRAGFMPDEVLEAVKKISTYDNLILEGVCTHFASSDSDKDFTYQQLEVFNSVLDTLKQNNISPKYIHTANSFGVVNFPESHFNLVRVGVGAYGYTPETKPVMSLKSKITLEKIIPKGHSVSYGCTWTAKEDTKIGIVPVGYGDGYKRSLSDKAKVLIDGQLYTVVGRVCMDQIIVELPKNGDFLEKDVLLFGDDERLNAQTLAESAGTISYEILTSIAERVPRIYK